MNLPDAPSNPEPGHATAAPPVIITTHLGNAEKRLIFRIFFFGAFALLLYHILRVLALFSDAIIWSASLALVFFPINLLFRRRLSARNGLAAGFGTVAVLLLVLIPLLLIGRIAMEQAAQLYPTVRDWITDLRAQDAISVETMLPAWLRDRINAIGDFLTRADLIEDFDLDSLLLQNIDIAGVQLANFGGHAARNILAIAGNLLLVAFGMFFCFRDGDRFVTKLIEITPMPTEQATAIAARVYLTVTAIIRGALVTAAVQGVLATIGYMLAGVPLALFFGIVTGIVAMIPVVGAALIWAPLGIVVMQHSPGWGLFVLAWGFFVVSLIDNVLKPILIGRGARLPILLMFLGVIGGINVYGFSGIIIGPILVACLLAFIQIYREHYAATAHGPGSVAVTAGAEPETVAATSEPAAKHHD
ncbi:MAG: AI-2E family transporter [Gammaproteobacteria bacterium]|nr:AI-2E family transporter [Gammaproteobacteria bacterium]